MNLQGLSIDVCSFWRLQGNSLIRWVILSHSHPIVHQVSEYQPDPSQHTLEISRLMVVHKDLYRTNRAGGCGRSNMGVGLIIYNNPPGTCIILVHPECLHPSSVAFRCSSHFILLSSYSYNTKSLSKHMACICGCDADAHLQNLPNRPASPNTFFESFWAPNFIEVLTSRLRTVLEEREPSKRVPWRHDFGGDTQDAAPPLHRWAKSVTFSDDSRGDKTPISRLPTPNFEEIMEEEQEVHQKLMQDWQCTFADLRETKKAPIRDDKEGDLHINTPIAPGAMHTSSFWPQELPPSTFISNVFNRPVPCSSTKLSSSTLPFQFDQGSTACFTPHLNSQPENLQGSPSLEDSRRPHLTSQASHSPMVPQGKDLLSTGRKVEGVDYRNTFKEQSKNSGISTLGSCLCACGGESMHCLRPNRPPSPNTFFENFWAPRFVPMLKTRLERVARELEPSRRIWWRGEFGGCAPDREPLETEKRAMKGENWGNVLKTSPPHFGNEFDTKNINYTRIESSRKRPHSMSPANPPIHSPDDSANILTQNHAVGHCYASKSAPLHTSGELWMRDFPNFRAKRTCGHSFIRTLNPPLRTIPPESTTRSFPERFPPFEITQSEQTPPTRTTRGFPTKDERQVWREKINAIRSSRNRHLGTNSDGCRNAHATNEESKVLTKRSENGWTHNEDSGSDLFRSTTTALRTKSPKSPTHYIPDRLPPLKIPDFSKKNPPHKIRERTAEEHEELLKSGLRKLEKMRLKMHRMFGTPLEIENADPSEKPRSASPGDQVEGLHVEVPAMNIPERLFPPRESDFFSKYAPCHKSMEFAARDHEEIRQPALQKLETMRSETQRQIEVPMRRTGFLSAKDPSPVPSAVSIKEEPSKTFLMKTWPTPNQSQQLVYRKNRAIKLKYNSHGGFTTHQFEAAPAQILSSIAKAEEAEQIPSIMRISEKNSTADEIQRLRQFSLQISRSYEMWKNSRQCTALDIHDEMSAEIPSPTFSIDRG